MEIKKINETARCLNGLAHTINSKNNNVAWLLKIRTALIDTSYNKCINSFATLIGMAKPRGGFTTHDAKR